MAAKKKNLGGRKDAVGANAALRDAEQFLLPTYKRPPIVFTHGRGAYVFDARGKKYLDFLGGIAVNALGHAHPRIVRVIRREAARAIHLSNLYHNAWQGPLAKKLVEWSGLRRAFFTNSGTEAIEGALKLARIHARRRAGDTTADIHQVRLLALENSFHGRTFGALSVTSTEKYRAPFAPLVPGVEFVVETDKLHSAPFAPLVPGVEFVRFNDVADLEAEFDATVCGILIEPIQGE